MLVPAASLPVQVQDDPIAQAVQKVTARAELAEELNRQYQERINVLLGRIADKEEIITLLKTQKGDLGEAVTLRTEARAIQLERIADRDKLIAKQDAEIARLRHPGFFASIIDKRTFGGAIAGYGICKATNGGTTLPTIPFQSSSSSFFNIQTATPADMSMFQTSTEQRVRDALKRSQKGSN